MAFPVPGTRLNQFERGLWRWLKARESLPQGICTATSTMARLFGVGVRYVQRVLKRFIRLGVLRRIDDYALRTRRRFFVVNSPAERPLFAGSEAGSFSALECADSAHSSAPTDAFPPDPPIEVSGESIEKGVGSGEPPLPSDLIDQAREAMRERTPSPSWLAAQVARYGLDWVRAAIAAAGRVRERDGSVGRAYVVATLLGFDREGGPEPAAERPPELTGDGKAVQSMLDNDPRMARSSTLRDWFTQVVGWPLARFEAAVGGLGAKKPAPGATLESPPGTGPKAPYRGPAPSPNHTAGVNPC